MHGGAAIAPRDVVRARPPPITIRLMGGGLARCRFLGDRENGLQMGRFLFPVDGRYVRGPEASLAEEIDDFDLGEAEPDVGIEFPCLFEGVALKIEDYDAASGF